MGEKELRFYRNEKEEWYLDLPEWNGDREDLQMIQGADKWLDLLSRGEEQIWVILSAVKFEEADHLTLMRLGEENLGGGGNYFLETYMEEKIDLKLWICEVTKFVFGEYPQRIYFRVISN